ncbi:HDIG domain-containing protein [Myxococcota bacterium]|nr:HDIG domain-containing protein [Myxococcota bacterium]MBU1413391.1 HDIG domain-containing protein [Myxococcota bacterium]MBU1510575.1 HDIG domain-containing protein [Myxococcota bacterium]
MIGRDEALALFDAQGPEASLRLHCLESEAVMAALARRLDADEELWARCGLLHDLDFPATAHDIARHGIPAGEMLAGKLPPEAVAAIVSHNFDNNGTAPPDSLLGWALRCGETVTGLVAANALVRPGGFAGMVPKSLKKKMKEKSFAANVDRNTILECEKLGLTLDEFFQIAIDAMTPLAPLLGLSPNVE